MTTFFSPRQLASCILVLLSVGVPCSGQESADQGNSTKDEKSTAKDNGEKKPGSAARRLLQNAGRQAGMLAPPIGPFMAVLDTDEDGVLSSTEIENASKSLLKLDRNGDGSVDQQEIRVAGPSPAPGVAMQGPPTPEMLNRMFPMADRDGDGKLTGEEIPQRLRERVEAIDQDGDGALTKDEMLKAFERFRDQMPRRGGQAGKDGGGVKPKRPPSE